MRAAEDVELCEGLKEIGECAFRYCIALQHFKVPSTVKVIGRAAFCDCDQLEEVELSEGLTMIGFAAFIRCGSLLSISIPSTVALIAGSAFKYCWSFARDRDFKKSTRMHWLLQISPSYYNPINCQSDY